MVFIAMGMSMLKCRGFEGRNTTVGRKHQSHTVEVLHPLESPPKRKLNIFGPYLVVTQGTQQTVLLLSMPHIMKINLFSAFFVYMHLVYILL